MSWADSIHLLNFSFILGASIRLPVEVSTLPGAVGKQSFVALKRDGQGINARVFSCPGTLSVSGAEWSSGLASTGLDAE